MFPVHCPTCARTCLRAQAIGDLRFPLFLQARLSRGRLSVSRCRVKNTSRTLRWLEWACSFGRCCETDRAYAIAYGLHTLEMAALRGWGVAFLAYVAATAGTVHTVISPTVTLTTLARACSRATCGTQDS